MRTRPTRTQRMKRPRHVNDDDNQSLPRDSKSSSTSSSRSRVFRPLEGAPTSSTTSFCTSKKSLNQSLESIDRFYRLFKHAQSMKMPFRIRDQVQRFDTRVRYPSNELEIVFRLRTTTTTIPDTSDRSTCLLLLCFDPSDARRRWRCRDAVDSVARRRIRIR